MVTKLAALYRTYLIVYYFGIWMLAHIFEVRSLNPITTLLVLKEMELRSTQYQLYNV